MERGSRDEHRNIVCNYTDRTKKKISEAKAVTAQSGPRETSVAPRDTDSDSIDQTKNSSQKHRHKLQGVYQK